MTLRSYLNWQRFWDFEPWGPWRDNLHAGIIAREIRRGTSRRGAKLGLEPYMVKSPTTRRKEGEQNMFALLKTLSTGVTPAEAEKRRRQKRKKRKGKR